jgi:hypothetical protein
MPRVVAQRTNGKGPVAAGTAPAGWTAAADLEEEFLRLVVWGVGRVGKTTLACQFEKPLALVACEQNDTGGARSIKRVEGVFVKVCDTREKVLQIADELDRDDYFRTVVIDSATALQDLVLQEILGRPLPEQLAFGTVSKKQYQVRSELTKETLRRFLNLRKHVVITAKDADHNPKRDEVEADGSQKIDMRPKFVKPVTDQSVMGPALGGSAAGWLNDACHVTQLLWGKEVKTEKRTFNVAGKSVEKVDQTETGRHIRMLRLLYHPNFMAGLRSERSDVPEFVEEPTYDKIMAAIRG